jgi:hypothetical protein
VPRELKAHALEQHTDIVGGSRFESVGHLRKASGERHAKVTVPGPGIEVAQLVASADHPTGRDDERRPNAGRP